MNDTIADYERFESCLQLIEKVNNSGSQAYQVILSVIPIVGITLASIVFFFIFLWNHRQKMAMIEKGTYKRSVFSLPIFSLFVGIVLISVGLALSLFFIMMTGGKSYSTLGGIIPLFLGIGMISFYLISKRDVPKNNNMR